MFRTKPNVESPTRTTMESAVHSREQLQKISQGQYKFIEEYDHWEHQEIRKRTHDIVHYIVKGVLEGAKRGEHLFSMVITHYLPGDFNLHLKNKDGQSYKTVDVLSYVLADLQQRFPDCAITTTKNEKYLIVDWS